MPGSRRRDNNRLAQVGPMTAISSRPGESDADVRRRYEREQEMERRVREARSELDRFDNRRRSSSPFEEGLVTLGNLIPRERARRRYQTAQEELREARGYKKGGKVKKMAKGGSTASKRADGCATKGKTKGRFV